MGLLEGYDERYLDFRGSGTVVLENDRSSMKYRNEPVFFDGKAVSEFEKFGNIALMPISEPMDFDIFERTIPDDHSFEGIRFLFANGEYGEPEHPVNHFGRFRIFRKKGPPDPFGFFCRFFTSERTGHVIEV